MLYSEKETYLVEFFQHMDKSEICLLPTDEDTVGIVASIQDPTQWTKWTDSSAKNDPPPDFYCDDLALMMDAMRVDDHGHKVHGTIVNPTYQREHMLEKELQEAGIFKTYPNVKRLFINAVTDLPTEEDHNYSFYLENFKRTVQKHIKHIPNYKKNHPGYKVIFFIFDESSAYVHKVGTPFTINGRTAMGAQQHVFAADKAFVDVFLHSDIDYIIWCAPFKYIEVIEGECLQPRAVVIRVKDYCLEPINYDPFEIMSVEL